MLDRLRQRLPGRTPTTPGQISRQRHVTRREREEMQRRMLYIGTAIAGVIVLVVLIAGALHQYVLLPRQDLASVNGEKIERRDYWKVRELQLRQTIATLSQQYSLVSADQQTEIQQRILLAQTELEDVKGAPVAADTLSSMIDDIVIQQNAEDMGITVSDQDVDDYLASIFAPAPLTEPTPTSTVEPTAAAWATETASAAAAGVTATAQAQATGAAETAVAQQTTAAETATAAGTEPATVTPTPEATEDPAASPAADSTGTATSDEAEGTPTSDDTEGTPDADATGTPAGTASPTPTLTADVARATGEATFEQFSDNYLDPSDMSRGDYERLVARPALTRQRIAEQLTAEIPARQEQVHARHILVATEDAARQAYDRVQTEDFAEVAQEVSTDTGTAGSGGDLGWFPRGVMVQVFEDTAFAMEPGAISEPVQSEFGWHVIQVLEKEDDRPVALSTLQSLRSNVFTKWLDARRAEADISADTALPQETPAAEFVAPPDAPEPPTPTVAPTSTLPPVASPESDEEGDGTPEAEATSTP